VRQPFDAAAFLASAVRQLSNVYVMPPPLLQGSNAAASARNHRGSAAFSEQVKQTWSWRWRRSARLFLSERARWPWPLRPRQQRLSVTTRAIAGVSAVDRHTDRISDLVSTRTTGGGNAMSVLGGASQGMVMATGVEVTGSSSA